MSANTYAIRQNLFLKPQAGQHRTSRAGRAAETRMTRAPLAVTPKLSRHRSCLGEHAARLYAAVAT